MKPFFWVHHIFFQILHDSYKDSYITICLKSYPSTTAMMTVQQNSSYQNSEIFLGEKQCSSDIIYYSDHQLDHEPLLNQQRIHSTEKKRSIICTLY